MIKFTIGAVLVAAFVALPLYLVNLIETQAPAFRMSEVDGYRLVWYSYGWSGAQAHFQEWNGRKWITTHRCEPFDSRMSTFEYGHKDKIDALEKKKVREALAYHASHGQAVHPPKKD